MSRIASHSWQAVTQKFHGRQSGPSTRPCDVPAALPAIFLMLFISCCGCSTFHPDLQELVNAVSFPANLRSPQLGPLSLRMRCPLARMHWHIRWKESRLACTVLPPRDLLFVHVHVVRPRIQSSASVSPRDVLRDCCQFLVGILARHVDHLELFLLHLNTFLLVSYLVGWRTIRRIFRSCAIWMAWKSLLHAFTVVCLSASLLVLPSSHSACSRSSATSLRIRIALVTSLSASAS